MVRHALDERLGHEVVELQENAVGIEDIRRAAQNADILLWVKTPDWLKVSDATMLV